MKENLFFRAARSIFRNLGFLSNSSILFMLPLLTLPLFFGATALRTYNPQENQQAIIYVGENVKIFGLEESSNARIVKISTHLKINEAKKTAIVKIEKQIALLKNNSRDHIKNQSKLPKPKSVVKVKLKGTDQYFGINDFTNTKNSVITSFFISDDILSRYFTKLTAATFFYLINIYVACFSKTAALSQFLFSRPPPALV